jgi:hypothetical protein
MPGNNISTGVANAGMVSDFPLSLVGAGLEVLGRVDDLATVTSSGGSISQVSDQSGHGRHATQASGPAKPDLDTTTFTRASAAFSAAQFLQIASSLASAMPSDGWTIWCVLQTDDAAANQGWISIGSLGGYALTFEGGNRTVRRQGVSVSTDAAVGSTTHLIVVTRSAGVHHLFVDNVELAITGASDSVGTPSGLSFIGTLDATFFKANGWIRQWGAVSRVFTGAPGIGSVCHGELRALASHVAQRYA